VARGDAVYRVRTNTIERVKKVAKGAIEQDKIKKKVGREVCVPNNSL